MNRQLIYPNSLVQDSTHLQQMRDTMIAMGKLQQALYGTTTQFNGLACTPTAPASMQVQVAAGEVYAYVNIDDTAFGALASDTTHQILKQGTLDDAVLLSCPAPTTAGQSRNYLIQAAFSEVDTNSTVLPYYNSSNPLGSAWSGPGNAGTAQNTARKGTCVVQIKVGVAAATGSQVTPTPDAGYSGLYVVTVANGATTIVSGNITSYTGILFSPAIGSVMFPNVRLNTVSNLAALSQNYPITAHRKYGTVTIASGGNAVITYLSNFTSATDAFTLNIVSSVSVPTAPLYLAALPTSSGFTIQNPNAMTLTAYWEAFGH